MRSRAGLWGRSFNREPETFLARGQKLGTSKNRARRIFEGKPASVGKANTPKPCPCRTQRQIVCQELHTLAPFIFNNGNTFATFAKKPCRADWAKTITPWKAQMLTGLTIGHYVTGALKRRKELLRCWKFLAAVMGKNFRGHRRPW